MTVVTVCSDFEAQEYKICHCFHFFSLLFVMKWWNWMPWSLFVCLFVCLFWMLSFKPAFSLCSFPLLKRLFSSPSLSAIDFPGHSAGKESSCSAGDPSSIHGSGRSTGKGIGYLFQYSWASLVAQLVKNLPAMWKTWVWSLGW